MFQGERVEKRVLVQSRLVRARSETEIVQRRRHAAPRKKSMGFDACVSDKAERYTDISEGQISEFTPEELCMRIIRLAILIFLLRIMRPISQRPEIPGFCREMGLEKSVPPQSTDFCRAEIRAGHSGITRTILEFMEFAETENDMRRRRLRMRVLAEVMQAEEAHSQAGPVQQCSHKQASCRQLHQGCKIW